MRYIPRPMPTPDIPHRSELPALRELLAGAGLSAADIDEPALRNFLVCREGAALVGSVGLDLAGRDAMLRSLAVAPARRGQGLAKSLVAAAEDLAVRRGVQDLYLLTTTARDFFLRRGWADAPRAAAPPAIAALPQFASLCPSTSAFMRKTVWQAPLKVLFLCTGNSARSILGEAIANDVAVTRGRLRGFSAGSRPRGKVHPLALELLQAQGLPTESLRSKSWDEFAAHGPDAPDVVITVCDNAANGSCPLWPGAPVRAHWGLPDPAAFDDAEPARASFRAVYDVLRRRIARLAALPPMGREALSARLAELAKDERLSGSDERDLAQGLGGI